MAADNDQIRAAVEAAPFYKPMLDWAWAIIAALGGLVWKRHTQDMKEMKGGMQALAKEIETKASVYELNRQRDNISELYRTARHDKEEIIEAISALKETVLTELGKRPTRDEIFQHRRKS